MVDIRTTQVCFFAITSFSIIYVLSAKLSNVQSIQFKIKYNLVYKAKEKIFCHSVVGRLQYSTVYR